MHDENQINAYRATMKKAWEHGAPTLQQHQVLENIKKELSIPDEVQQQIETEFFRNVSDEYRIKTYKAVLLQAWSDETISDDEQAIIDRLKSVLRITDEEHRIIENQIRNQYKEKGNSPENNPDIPVRQPVPNQANNLVRVRQPVKQAAPPQKPKQATPDGDADFWLNQGELIFTNSNGDVGKIEQAIEYFNKAIEIEPLNYLAWSNKGLGLKILNRFDDALMCYERALTFQPDHINTWFNKAVLLGCMSKYEEALECYRKVLELDPDHELALRDLRIITQFLNQY